MSAEDDLRTALAAYLDEDERAAKILTTAARQSTLREIAAKRTILAEHLPIESIYGLTCKRCVSWQEGPWAEGGKSSSEFGIAIPDPWPCLPVGAIAVSSQENLARAIAILIAGHRQAEADYYLAKLPDRMKTIADQLSETLPPPDGMRLEWG